MLSNVYRNFPRDKKIKIIVNRIIDEDFECSLSYLAEYFIPKLMFKDKEERIQKKAQG